MKTIVNVLKSILFPIYKLFQSFRRIFNRNYKYYLWFTLPNMHIIRKKQVSIGNNVEINQRVLLTGKGNIKIGANVKLGYKLGGFIRGSGIEIQARTPNSKITIGDNVFTNNNIFICSSGEIIIEKDTLIGNGVIVMDFEAHSIHPNKRRKTGEIGKVLIKENVWIGNNVTVLKNSIIGKNSIIASNAVVSGKFPDNVVLGGVPAKIIKTIDLNEAS